MSTGRWIYFIILALIWCVECLPAADAGYDPVVAAKQMSDEVILIRSASGRLAVTSDNRFDAYDFARWAEDILLRLERITGVVLPARKEPLIKVFFKEGKDAPFINAASAAGVYVVTLSGYSSNLVESVMETLCLGAMYLAAGLEPGPSVSSSRIPAWMAQGVAQNLYPELRKRNSEHIISQWQKGEMPPLDIILSESPPGFDAEEMRMVRGVFFSWLMSLGGEKDILSSAVRLAIEHQQFDRNDLYELIKDAGIADLDYAWDAWMLRQKRTVFLPGDAGAQDLAWLKRQMLISSEEFDKDKFEAYVSSITFADLIDLKGQDWIKAPVQNRILALRLKSAGKSDGFRAVVEALCDFLQGVLEEEFDWRLRSKLKVSEDKMMRLEADMLNVSLKDGNENGKQESNEQKGQ